MAQNPIDISDRDVLTAASKCFDCLSHSQKQLAIIWLMTETLKALGGDDLTDVNNLRDAVKCWSCESDSALEAFLVYISYANAVDAGMDTMTVYEIRDALKCWQCIDPKTLKAAFPYLIAKISQAQTLVL